MKTACEVGRKMARAAWAKANTARRLNSARPSVRGVEQVLFRANVPGKDEDGVPACRQRNKCAKG